MKSWEEAYRKAAELVSQMTLTEKGVSLSPHIVRLLLGTDHAAK